MFPGWGWGEPDNDVACISRILQGLAEGDQAGGIEQVNLSSEQLRFGILGGYDLGDDLIGLGRRTVEIGVGFKGHRLTLLPLGDHVRANIHRLLSYLGQCGEIFRRHLR